MNDKINNLWNALKAECCKQPDEAKTIVFLNEEKFRKAITPLLDSDSQASAPVSAGVGPTVDDLENSVAFKAYNQAIEDTKAAIRAESQGGGYWAAAYINAIARRCSPHVYANRLVGQPETDFEQLSREQIVQAISDIQEARESHAQWANHLRNEKHALCEGCDQFAAHIGTAEYHDEWIAKYDNVIAVLARTPFAVPAPSAAIQDEATTPRKWVYSKDVMEALDETFDSLKGQRLPVSEVGFAVYRRLAAVPEFTEPRRCVHCDPSFVPTGDDRWCECVCHKNDLADLND